jgi:hypothetical protein
MGVSALTKRDAMGQRMWRKIALLAFACTLLAAPASAANPLAWSPVSRLAGPGAAQEFDKLQSLSCPREGGECTAVGRYRKAEFEFAPLGVGVLDGVWEAGSALDEIGEVELTEISCSVAGDCGAIGGGDPDFAAVDSESDGVWGVARRLTLPINAQEGGSSYLSSISCPSPGTCVAVGIYTGPYHPNSRATMIAEETGGTWRQAMQAIPPANSSAPSMTMESVSCSAPGWCAIVGSYTTTDNEGYERREPFVMDQTDGAWQQAKDLPPGVSTADGAELTSVSCTAPGACSAIGDYTASAPNRREGLAAQESGGVWTVTPLRPAADSAEAGIVELRSLSCAQPGSCAAVGDYAAAGSPNEITRPATVDQSMGAWGAIRATSLPSDATGNGALASVSCYAAGACAAVGFYDKQHGEYGLAQAMTDGETSGVWAPAAAAVTSSGASIAANTALEFVSCSVAPSCAASGTYETKFGNYETMVTSAQIGSNDTLAGGSTGLTTTHRAGTPPSSTPALPKPSRPALVGRAALALASTTAVASGNRVRVRLSCLMASCSGRVALSAPRSRTVHGRASVASGVRSVVLAAARFDFSGPAKRTIVLRMTAAGRKLLRRARTRHPTRGLVLTIDASGRPAQRWAVHAT